MNILFNIDGHWIHILNPNHVLLISLFHFLETFQLSIAQFLAPQVVHMAHLVVEHGEEAKKEVESDDVGQVEGNVPAVRKQDSEPLSFFQIDNTFVGNNTLTNKP